MHNFQVFSALSILLQILMTGKMLKNCNRKMFTCTWVHVGETKNAESNLLPIVFSKCKNVEPQKMILIQ
jgi:hypothetical protein